MQIKSSLKIILIFLVFTISVTLRAAVGCTLTDPDRDVRRLFPESTNYQTFFLGIKLKGGESLRKIVEKKLMSTLEDYSEYEIEYAWYKVLRGNKPIGFIFGTNEKGKYSNIQVMISTKLDGQILNMYYQMLSAPYANVLKSPRFTSQFIGLSLRDFYHADGQAMNYNPGVNRVKLIKPPIPQAAFDTQKTIRAIKKVLILYDVFWLNGKYDRFYKGI